MFRRSNEGLANEHLFYDVEFVVYCEGVAARDGVATLDEAYWHRIFSLHGRRVKCKSRGSKRELLDLADIVLSNQIDNLILAMDRDYDDPYLRRIEHPRILYTYGYSWESDVVSKFDFAVAVSIFASAANLTAMENEYRDFTLRQSIAFRRAAFLDVKYFFHECKLFDRKKPMSIIVSNRGKEPKLNRKKLVSTARNLRLSNTPPVKLSLFRSSNGLQIFFGKTVAHLIFQWFCYSAFKLGERRNVRYSSFMSLLISIFSLGDGSDSMSTYYKTMLGKI